MTHVSRRCQKFGQANDVIGSAVEDEHRANLGQTPNLQVRKTPDGLVPAEDLLDPFAPTSALRPGGGAPEPSFGWKLFIDAQAFSKVPSTEKCSTLISRFTSGSETIVDSNCRAIPVLSKRSP